MKNSLEVKSNFKTYSVVFEDSLEHLKALPKKAKAFSPLTKKSLICIKHIFPKCRKSECF